MSGFISISLTSGFFPRPVHQINPARINGIDASFTANACALRSINPKPPLNITLSNPMIEKVFTFRRWL